MLSESKRGQFQDGLYFVMLLFIGGVVFLSYSYVVPNIATALNNTGNFNSTDEQAAVTNLYNMGTSGINQAFLILFGGLILVQVASSFFVRYHPVFLIIFFAMMIVNGFLAISLGNAFDSLSDNSALTTTLATQPVMTFVFDHFLLIAIVVDILSLFVLFAKVGEAQV